jgi:hypothetical protein
MNAASPSGLPIGSARLECALVASSSPAIATLGAMMRNAGNDETRHASHGACLDHRRPDVISALLS